MLGEAGKCTVETHHCSRYHILVKNVPSGSIEWSACGLARHVRSIDRHTHGQRNHVLDGARRNTRNKKRASRDMTIKAPMTRVDPTGAEDIAVRFRPMTSLSTASAQGRTSISDVERGSEFCEPQLTL